MAGTARVVSGCRVWQVTRDRATARRGRFFLRAGGACSIMLLLLVLQSTLAVAQAPPAEPPERVLPPMVPPRPEIELPPRLRVFVQRVNVVGSTVFPPEVLSTVTGRYENRYLTQEDLQALRLELTKLYVDRG